MLISPMDDPGAGNVGRAGRCEPRAPRARAWLRQGHGFDSCQSRRSEETSGGSRGAGSRAAAERGGPGDGRWRDVRG
jgi:hypothetical protein